jgi:hypothetical protein
MVRAQKLRGIMKNSEEITYAKSNHSHLPRAAGGTFLPAEDPRTSGVGPWPLVLLEAGVGSAASASEEAAEDSAASPKAAAPPPASSLAAGDAAEVLELRSAFPPPLFSGVWGPAPPPRSRRHAGASGTCSPRLATPRGTRIILVPVLRHRHLLFPLPGGGRTSRPRPLGPQLVRCGRSGEAPGMWSPRLGSPPSCRTARPPSSRVAIDARTDTSAPTTRFYP